MTKNEYKLCDILRNSDDMEEALLLAIKIFSAFAEPPQEAQEPLLADLRESC
jgi:hypothetical protein